MSRRRFAIRTIKNGTVRIFGETYMPEDSEVPYDGRLDGQRWAFGLYQSTPEFVFLWGTEAAYHGADDWDTRPDVVDGFFVWVVWRKA
jgi:hypothetical protein